MRNLIYFVLIAFVAVSCNESGNTQNVVLLKDSLLKINTQLDSFRKSTPITGGEMDYWQDSKNVKLLGRQGIKNPAGYIANDLSKHTELIPFKSTLGGQMLFGRITLLGEHWAIAHVEDGHIGGQLLLSYTMKSPEHIQWKVLDALETD